MKRHILFFSLFTLFSLSLFSQPANDDCDGFIDLGMAPYCDTTDVFSNTGATASDIGYTNIPPCWDAGNVDKDVWFRFTSSNMFLDYTFTVTGVDVSGDPILVGPQLAIYRGECEFDGLALLYCGDSGPLDTELKLNLLGLDPNELYWLRINNTELSGGSFNLCIEERVPITTIDIGGTTTECSGELYDSGGPDANYGSNENFVYTICPEFPNNACINFNLDYYNINFTNGDQLNFYDGPDNTSQPIDYSSNPMDYYGVSEDAGSVCQTIQASSGCMTVEFISMASIEFEGFAGSWECSSTACEIPAELEIEEGASDEQISDILAANGTIVTVDTIICNSTAYGTFKNGDQTNLGLGEGLVLSSGLAIDASGPNDVGFQTTDLGEPGDADLDSLSVLQGDGNFSNDACVVEVSVFANTPNLTFEYTFGSEEYPEFVDQFNDIFAFLISGPGITGVPSLNNQFNLATLPLTGDPVQINSVNFEDNWQYYRDNLNGQSIQFDGLTSDYLGIKKSLTASIGVEPCQTYKLKLAVADRFDSSFDSGVFVSEISSGLPTASLLNADGLDYFVEGCSNIGSQLIITLSDPFLDTTFLELSPGGDAQIGVDYLLDIPDPLFVLPGQTQLTFPIEIINDNIDEGNELLTFALLIDYGCGAVAIDSVASTINDVPEIVISIPEDTVAVCVGDCIDVSVVGASDYHWSPSMIVFPANEADVTICPAEDGWVSVVGSIGGIAGCEAYDSVFVDVRPFPELQLDPDGPYQICVGESITLTAINNVNDEGLLWESYDFIPNPTGATNTLSPTFNTLYTVTATLGNCTTVDSAQFFVDDYFFPDFLVGDTIICQDDVLQITDNFTSYYNTTQYTWTPESVIQDINGAPIFANTSVPGTFTVTLDASSVNNFCGDTYSFDLIIEPLTLDIVQGSEVAICLGESIDITADLTPVTADFVWTSSTGSLADPSALSFTVSPTETTTYTATASIGGCTLVREILVTVDALPEFEITAFPSKVSYCEGDFIVLKSTPDIDEVLFPTIDYQWIGASPGAQSVTDAENLSIEATTDFLYQRVTTNGVCEVTSEIFIDVFIPQPLTIAGSGPICTGESVQLEALQSETTDFSWSNSESLSCSDCANPIASPDVTTTYTVFAEVNGCPIQQSITIEVFPSPDVQFPIDTFICEGESVQLNEVIAIPGYTYTWSASPLDPSLTDQSATGNPNVSPTQTTTYTIVMNNGQCTELVESVTIALIDIVTLDLEPIVEDICEGEEITIEAVSNVPGQFTWLPNGETTNSITVSPDQSTTYRLNFDYGCGFLEDSTLINVIVPQDFGLVCTPDTLVEGVDAMITLDPIHENASYAWTTDPNTGTLSSNGQSLAFMASEDFNVKVVATFSDVEGCTSETSKDISVIRYIFDMPNAFTPDGDKVNDFFIPSTDPDSEYKFEIKEFEVYNRWGQQVYTYSVGSEGWDGTFNGNPAPTEVYLYNVVFVRPDGTDVMYRGNVTLIR